jgi:hypothetical protein
MPPLCGNQQEDCHQHGERNFPNPFTAHESTSAEIIIRVRRAICASGRHISATLNRATDEAF